MRFTTAPLRVQISTSCGNPLTVMRWENGRLIFATSTYCPPGDGVTAPNMAGRPMAALTPVVLLIAASWLVN